MEDNRNSWKSDRGRDSRVPRHPPHLKGKQIGLYYANLSKRFKENRDQEKVSLETLSFNEEEMKDTIWNLQNNKEQYSCHIKSNFLDTYNSYLSNCLKTSSLGNLETSGIKQVPSLDEKLFDTFKQQQESSNYKKMQEVRSKLPINKVKQEILDIIHKNQVVLLSGETGCGKTTQVPQYILDSYIEAKQGSLCKIVCTQPRRISAISVAERVVKERNTHFSNSKEIGYQIRLEKRLPQNKGSILYCTTGILIQWLQTDELLSSVSHVIVDEVHERSLLSDFLLIILKDMLDKRPDLKVILMSATLEHEKFSEYFGDCPTFKIEGFTYPVEVSYLEDAIQLTRYTPAHMKRAYHSMNIHKFFYQIDQEISTFYKENKAISSKYSISTMSTVMAWREQDTDLNLIFELIQYLDCNKKEGAILVFLPGWEDINNLYSLIMEERYNLKNRCLVYCLHSMMPTANQREVFLKPPPFTRKIVLATNIAETSITIEDVVYVIDCGKSKVKNFDPRLNISTLQAEFVALSNLQQRKGRAGRTQPGECYHLLSQYMVSKLDPYQQPEILRTRLEEMILMIKILKLGDANPFLAKAMQPPDDKTVDLSIKLLYNMGALGGQETLTPLGYHLARLNMDPNLGKMLLFGTIFSCLDPILSIVACLSYKDPFQIPLGQEKKASSARQKLANRRQSDHLMLAFIIKEWEDLQMYRRGFRFADDNYLSTQTLKYIVDCKKQYMQLLKDFNFVENLDPRHSTYNIHSANENLLRAIICAGLYPNVAHIKSINRGGMHLMMADQSSASLHQMSVNSVERNPVGDWLIYHKKIKSTKVFIHDTTVISAFPLLLFGGIWKACQQDDDHVISIDDWIMFKSHPETSKLIEQQLRSKMLTA